MGGGRRQDDLQADLGWCLDLGWALATDVELNTRDGRGRGNGLCEERYVLSCF